MVLAFDGVNKEVVSYAMENKITCIAECNPLHGPRVQAIIEQLEAGYVPEKFNFVDEGIFSADETVTAFTIDGAEYEVSILTEEVLEKREY